MSSNIACFTPGCTNAVIGQCPGYNGTCGRFYCAEHSKANLCRECGARKEAEQVAKTHAEEEARLAAAREAEVQRLYQEYSHIAEGLKIKSPPKLVLMWLVGWLAFYSSLAAFFVGWAYTFNSYSSSRLSGIACIITSVVLLVVGIYGFRAAKKIDRQVKAEFQAGIDQIAKGKAGFAEFYTEWRKRKTAEQRAKDAEIMKAVLGTALVVGAFAASAMEEHKRQQERHDIHDIAEALRKR